VNDNPQSVPPGWYPDPTARHAQRYWDGQGWTEHVASKKGVQSTDPPTREPVEPAGSAVGATAKKVPVFGARRVAKESLEENARLQRLIDEHGLRELAEVEKAVEGVRAQLDAAQQELKAERAAVQGALAERAAVQSQVLDLRSAVELQEFGLYDVEHPAESSVSLGTGLETLRVEIKQAISAGHATTATTNFTFNNSAAKGRKFVRDMSKLMLRAYNAEAENCVKTVRAGNLSAAQKRLGAAVDQIARLGSMIDLRVTPYFHGLRLRELELASRHLQALQIERELERARREELRQQRLAEQELAREKERLEKERAHYLVVLSTLEGNGDESGVARIREKLADVERAIEEVDYRVANIRAGYVYVISNIGSFGPEVVKIGMTRRLDPMDRVNELGDASVPFRFDVHALFFAEDAVGIETGLHQRFAERRLNKINLRREYFRVTPGEVLEALREQRVELLEFTLEAAAPEWRSSGGHGQLASPVQPDEVGESGSQVTAVA
jgi:Protein of unknown function (DUF2510)./T5orf172 domain.